MNRRFSFLLQFVLLAALPTFFSSCKASSYQYVPEATGPVQEGMCRVYVARSAQFWGAVRRVEIIDRDRTIGDIGKDGYLCWDRLPGKNPIQVFYHGANLDEGAVEGIIDFQGEPGGVYYYAVHLRKGDRKPEIKLLDRAAGEALIADRKPAEIQ